MQPMTWISVDVALPEDRQAVLVRYAGDNWLASHTLADGSQRKHWRWQAAMFRRGRTEAEIRAAGRPYQYSSEDESANNRRPYAWVQFGPGHLFGQDVTHWAAITDPMD